MKTVRSLLYREVIWSVVFVSLAFLSLFYFIDFLDEMEDIGRSGRTLGRAVLTALLRQPSRCYELMPISVLIGTIYSMARLAQSSEFTILRTGGLGPGRALSLLLSLGLMMSVATFVIGEYLAPLGEQMASQLRAERRGPESLGKSGAWLKEHRVTADGPMSVSINVKATNASGTLLGIRIFEHDAQGRLINRIEAESARADGQVWRLKDVTWTRWPIGNQVSVITEHLEQQDWATTLAVNVVEAAVSPITNMSTLELWRYSQHLADQEQTSQRYELQFWKRVFYPLACIVMVALALPFAYMQARAGGISIKVFGGIMLGISFILLNNVFGHLGLLHTWTPWMAASVPSLIYLGLSLAAFGWLVRYR